MKSYILGYRIGFSIDQLELLLECNEIFHEIKPEELVINIYCYLNGSKVHFVNSEKIVAIYDRAVWLSKLLRYYHELIYMHYSDTNILLHASCLEINNMAIAIMGASKSGKSTCVYNLMQNPKCRYITDDVALLGIEDSKVVPSPQTVLKLRFPVKNGVEINDTGNKSKIQLYSFFKNKYATCNSARQLDKIILLSYEAKIENQMEILTPFDSLKYITKNIFNIHKIKISALAKLVTGNTRVMLCKYDGNVKFVENILNI